MFLDKIQPLLSAQEVYVIIEITMNSDPVKYELHKDSGAIMVDRILKTAMFYPGNYGFIPNTLSGDGDPVDVLVIARYPFIAGSIIRSRPIGVLMMEDDDEDLMKKIIAVPVSKIDQSFDNIKQLEDLDPIYLLRISHFFEHYKDLEKGKWVKIIGWENADKAMSLIKEGIKRNV